MFVARMKLFRASFHCLFRAPPLRGGGNSKENGQNDQQGAHDIGPGTPSPAEATAPALLQLLCGFRLASWEPAILAPLRSHDPPSLASAPARRDRADGALVPTLPAVVSRHRGAARRSRFDVDHVTVYRWVQRFTPLLDEAARPCRHAVGDRWQADETYVKIAGHWRYVYRAIDQFGQVIDVFTSTRRNAAAARRFFKRAISTTKITPIEVVTDRAPVYPTVLEELLPFAWHRTERYANNRVEADHGRLKARLGPMRGLKQELSTSIVIAGHAFVQNLRRGHYELAVDEPVTRRVAVAFSELALAI
jgi:IS6 family transposase